MRIPEVNLARRPFANTRPVFRVTAALWVVGGLLALGNLLLYGRSLAGLDDLEDRIAAAEAAIEEERARVANAEDTLRGLDLREQNELAVFLNQRIDERTFPWSRLFDHLAEVLPRDVRLHALSPRRSKSLAEGSRAMRAGDDDAPDRVGLAMTGQAQTDAALLELLDNLFASDWFVEPSLASETRSPDNTLRYQLSVAYLPAGPLPESARVGEEARVAAEPGPGTEAPAADGETATASRRAPDETASRGSVPAAGVASSSRAASAAPGPDRIPGADTVPPPGGGSTALLGPVPLRPAASRGGGDR